MPARADDRLEFRLPGELKDRFHRAVPRQERSEFMRRALEAALAGSAVASDPPAPARGGSASPRTPERARKAPSIAETWAR